jgi:uncharacterized protein
MLNKCGRHLGVIVKVTDACNSNCKYCFQKKINSTKLDFYDLKKFCEITFPYYDDINLHLHGGEPTMIGSGKILEFIKMFENIGLKHNVNLNLTLQTNGIMLDDAFIKSLKEHNVWVGVSFDGINHDELRGYLAEKIIRVKKLFSKNQNDLFFRAVCVVSKLTYKDILSNYEYFKQQKMNAKFIPYWSPDKKNDRFYLEPEKSARAFLSLFDRWLNDCDCNISIYPFIHMISDYYRGFSSNCSNCNCLKNFVTLLPNGNLVPCLMDFPSEYVYANVNDIDNFLAIYDSPSYIKLKNLSEKRRKKCKNFCDIYQFCKGGCNLSAHLEGDIGNNKSFFCLYFKKLFKQIIERVNEEEIFQKVDLLQNPILKRYMQHFRTC